MKIWHPHHRTAFSRRTEGFPVMCVGSDGKILDEFPAQKRAGLIDVPEGTRYLVHLYWSNTGRLTVYVYQPKDGFPEVARWQMGQDDKEDLDHIAAMLGYGEVWNRIMMVL